MVGGGTFDNMTPVADAIAGLLLLIFRNREAAVQNPIQARSIKHRESYDAKMLNNVLGVAVQQILSIGWILYNFNHFDCPEDNE